MMQYEHELKPLLDWVSAHPGLTAEGLKRTINAVPWPAGDPSTWNPPYEGTRIDTPSLNCLKWKLRYMELTGDVWCEKKKWYATMPNAKLTGDPQFHRGASSEQRERG